MRQDHTKRIDSRFLHLLFTCLINATILFSSADAQVDLPWEKEKTNTDLPSLGDATVRELLIDLDDSELRQLYDYGPVESDCEAMINVLFRFEQFTSTELARYSDSNSGLTAEKLVKDSQANRLKMLRIKGTVNKIEREVLLKETAERYLIPSDDGKNAENLTHYYKVFATIEPNNHPVMICCRRVPFEWRKEPKLLKSEPFEATAMYMKISGDEKDTQPELVMSAKRIEWYPDENTNFKLETGLIRLSESGFDLSQLQNVRKGGGKDIGRGESFAFHSMIAAAKSIDLANEPVQPFDLMEALGKPTRPYGKMFEVEADVRRVTRIEVTNPYYIKKLGLREYYQLDAFLKIDRSFKQKFDEEKIATFKNRFPITICVSELSPEINENSTSVQRVRVRGFFYKNWTFRSDWIKQYDENAKQIAPLIIAKSPVFVEQSQAVSGVPAILITVIGLVFITLVWMGFRRTAGRITTPPEFKLNAIKDLEAKNAEPKTKLPNDEKEKLPRINL